MNYYNTLTDEQRRILQNAADLLHVTVGSLLGLLRDDQLHALARSGFRPAEQYQVAPTHPPDTALAAITDLALQSQELLVGGYPWLWNLPPLVEAALPQENLSDPSPWPSAHIPPFLGDIADPHSAPFSTCSIPTSQFRLDHFPLEPVPSFPASDFDTTLGCLDLSQHMSPHNHDPLFTTSLHVPGSHAATAQAPRHTEQPTIYQLPVHSTTLITAPTPSPTQGTAPRRRHFSARDRDQTAWTRKRRACMQCRQNRKRVSHEEEEVPQSEIPNTNFGLPQCLPDENNSDPGSRCLCCQQAALNSGINRLPCLRRKIVDSSLFRTTGHKPNLDPFALTGPSYGGFCVPKIWAAHSPIKTLSLTQGYGTVLRLRVREFKPPQGDNEPLDSRGRSIYAVPWALADADDALSSVRTFLEESVDAYLDRYAHDFDEITRLVFSAARDRSRAPNCEERPLFRDLLHFWTAARFIEGGWRCEGPEKLDADKLPDPLNPPRLVAPPPYIDFQLAAVVMERVLKPLQKRILTVLEKLVFTGRARNWLRIFLVIFVLLQGYELAFAHEVAWTRKRQHLVSCPAIIFFLTLAEQRKELTAFVIDPIRGCEPRSQLPRGRQDSPSTLPPHVQGRYSPQQRL